MLPLKQQGPRPFVLRPRTNPTFLFLQSTATFERGKVLVLFLWL
jgi:hypothetical protein